MTQVNARIDKEIYDRLSEYSEITGVPVSRCIAEACERWLTVVAPTRIEAMQRPVFGGGVSALVGHPHVTEEGVTAQGKERTKDPKMKK